MLSKHFIARTLGTDAGLRRAHVPLIKFLGKRRHEKRDPEQMAAPPQSIQSKAPAEPRVAPPVMTPEETQIFLAAGAFYGRPMVTEEEIAAVATGGASLFDNVR